jgi:hypothetical protein
MHDVLSRNEAHAQARTGRARRIVGAVWSSVLGLPVIRRLRGLQLRRLRPFAEGRQRGQPVVRYYWERFLDAHRADIRGIAIEVGSTYALGRHGGGAVVRADALDVARHSAEISVVADLSRADAVPADVYDCFINPFTMHLIYDVDAAIYHSIRILKPGGVLLVNFPCVDYYFHRGLDMGTGRPLFMFWWFTPLQVDNLLRRAGLERADYQTRIDGNLFARVAYQMNMPAEELSRQELDHVDEGHPLLISARIVKPAGWYVERPPYKDAWTPVGRPVRWNPSTGHYAEM